MEPRRPLPRVLGANNPSALNPTWIKSSGEPELQFAYAVAGAGDVNGDGFSDFLVGTPGYYSDSPLGEVFLFQGQGQRAITPRDDPFFESVDPEAYAFYNLRNPDFGAMLAATGQNDPVRLDQVLTALRAKINSTLIGTPREPDAMAALAQLQQFVPANLWQQHFGDLQVATGGALYLDCGGTNETLDAVGRRWKPDAPFLVGPSGNLAFFNNEVVDQSLLTDPSIPNNVILSERWRDGDISYEIPVENGPHTVILYFSENCTACVSTNMGGTGPAGAARIFDIEVEGWRTNAYNPADAAVPPADDGVGATFKATQVIFRNVPVNDGVLNVTIHDLGAGDPPENAAIKAMAILQMPSASGLAAPRLLSIRRVEANYAITVRGAPNLPSILAGLAEPVLEQSPDLLHWSEVPVAPYTYSGNVVFEFPPQGNMRFYRVLTRSTGL